MTINITFCIPPQKRAKYRLIPYLGSMDKGLGLETVYFTYHFQVLVSATGATRGMGSSTLSAVLGIMLLIGAYTPE